METVSGKRRPRTAYIEYLEKRIAPATFVVTNLNDSGAGSLRDAVDKANAAPGADAIVFNGLAVSGEIALSTGEIAITDSVKIKGPGAAKLAIDAQNLSRIFNIDDGTAAVMEISISGLSLIDGNSGIASGGGIRSVESLTLVNSVLSGCRASGSSSYGSGNGGGLYVLTEGKAVIRNSKITGNVADFLGGGIHARAAGGLQIIDSVISGNTGTAVGGGVYARIFADETGDILISGSTILGNAAWRGGGLSLENNIGKITLRDTLISGNSATIENSTFPTGGGGLYSGDGITVIERCTISNNVSTHYGGGMGISGLESMTVRNSKIINNLVTSETGAGGGVRIFGEGNRTTFQNTQITSNVSNGDGGGVFAINGRFTVHKSTISGNIAFDDGGGIAARQSTLNFERSIVRDNIAGNYGGGSYTGGFGAERTDVQITRSLFASNRAAYGGGVDTRGDGSITINTSRFLQNVASTGDGGGLYLRSNTGSISITDSLIVQNVAADDGGGVALRADVLPISITNTVIRDNVAVGNGGGVALFDEILNLRNVTVTGNIAGSLGGGIWNASLTPLTFNGSKVTGNIAPTGPQIYGPVAT